MKSELLKLASKAPRLPSPNSQLSVLWPLGNSTPAAVTRVPLRTWNPIPFPDSLSTSQLQFLTKSLHSEVVDGDGGLSLSPRPGFTVLKHSLLEFWPDGPLGLKVVGRQGKLGCLQGETVCGRLGCKHPAHAWYVAALRPSLQGLRAQDL